MARRLHPRGWGTPVCGRKHCSLCGHWRLLVDFDCKKRGPDGEPLRFAHLCKICRRRYMNDYYHATPEKFLARQREWHRLQRRLKGSKPRYADERGYTGQLPLEAYRPMSAKGRQTAMVDATAFLAWYDDWIARQEHARGSRGPGDNLNWMDLATAADVCELAGFSWKRISDARRTGRIDYAKAEAFLVNAGCAEPWRILDDAEDLAA